jgi:uncharacterized membrane protein (UPF0182 family)
VFLHRLYRDFAAIAAAVVAIIGFEMALNVSLQNYWFGELGQTYRYWFALGHCVAIFCAVLVLAGAFLGFNLHLLCRSLAAVPRSAPWFAAFIFAALVGLGATTDWVLLIGFLGATPSGTRDPVFAKDLSFYLLALPWYDAVVATATIVLVATIAASAVIALAFYPRSGRPWQHPRPLRLVAAGETARPAQDERIWEDWLRQGLALAVLFCLTMGVARLLGRYHLVIGGHSEVVAGGSYADVYFWIPAYTVIAGSWFAAAFLLLLTLCLPRLRRLLRQRPSLIVLPVGLFGVLYLGAVLISPGVEQVYVGPNQITLERAYLVRSIAGTREAYWLAGPSVVEREFAVSAVPLTRTDLDANGATLQDARIWD